MGAVEIMASIDQSIVSLLSSKSTHALLRLMPASDLVLACCALAAASHAAPAKAPVVGRVSFIATQVLLSIALNTALQWIATTQDAALASVSMLAIFFWGGALDPGGEISLTAQYLLVASLTDKLAASKDQALLAASWATAFCPGRLIPSDASNLAQLVTTESLNSLLKQWMPRSTLLPATVVLLYLCAPFAGVFPPIGRIYRFAVFALTTDRGISHTQPWLVASGLWALWQLESDPVSKRLLVIAGISFATLALLEVLRFAMDNDPAPTLIALLLTIRILNASTF